jgi:hypothetical protein
MRIIPMVWYRARSAEKRFPSPALGTLRNDRSYPDVLPLAHGIEDAFPASAGVKDRHVEHEHRIVRTVSYAKPVPPFRPVMSWKIRLIHC